MFRFRLHPFHALLCFTAISLLVACGSLDVKAEGPLSGTPAPTKAIGMMGNFPPAEPGAKPSEPAFFVRAAGAVARVIGTDEPLIAPAPVGLFEVAMALLESEVGLRGAWQRDEVTPTFRAGHRRLSAAIEAFEPDARIRDGRKPGLLAFPPAGGTAGYPVFVVESGCG